MCDIRGHSYAVLLVDFAKRYCEIYGMSFLFSTSIISEIERFKLEEVQLPKRFHSDFERKLIGGRCPTLDPC